LNNPFKIKLKGYILSTGAETEEIEYNANSALVLPDLIVYNYNPVLKLGSPQIVNQITNLDGFLIPLSTTTDLSVLPVEVKTAATKADTKWIVSHKPSCVIGDPMAHYISVNLNSNVISFQARLSLNDGLTFNSNMKNYLTSGTLILTFEYESLKANF
jgi:hypothetical protein